MIISGTSFNANAIPVLPLLANRHLKRWLSTLPIWACISILSSIISQAYASKKILGAVCHGPLGFIGATKPDGSALVKNVKVTGVTNKQLRELMVGNTPKHPETELKKANAKYESKSGLIDMFMNHIVVDKTHQIVTGQNQKGGVEAAQNTLKLLEEKVKNKNELDLEEWWKLKKVAFKYVRDLLFWGIKLYWQLGYLQDNNSVLKFQLSIKQKIPNISVRDSQKRRWPTLPQV